MILKFALLVRFSLYRFLPAACPDWISCDEDATGPQKKKDKRLDFGWWQVGIDGYAISAISLGQWTVRDYMMHKKVVIGIAANSSGEKRSPWLAVLYDELCS